VQIPAGALVHDEPLFVNRVLAAATLLLMAGLLDAWIRAVNALADQNEELDRLRRIADEASGRKTELLAAVSHDIRTPLMVIDLIAENVSHAAGDPARAAEIPEMVRRLKRNTDSLARLGAALVDIAALDAGHTDLHLSRFSLNDLLAEERQRLLPLAQAKGLQFTVEGPEPPLSLLCDRTKLTRILSNLLGNAFKFTRAGHVTVTVSLTAGNAPLIRVSDSGIGMKPEDVERVFEEYGQLGNPERDSKNGWGLGLAICWRLVKAMGGRITVESEWSRGTVFSVYLPASCVADRRGPAGKRVA
jgi:signal transduction histidine kinase